MSAATETAGTQQTAGRAVMTALGFLHTAHTAHIARTAHAGRPDPAGSLGRSGEDDYARVEQLLGSDIRLDVVHVADVADVAAARPGEDGGAVGGDTEDAVQRLGPPERLAAAGEQLRLAGAEAVVWACTGGSARYGWEGAHAQTAALARTAGMPASSTSLAFVNAVRELGTRQVAVGTVRPVADAARFADFLRAGGAEVTGVLATEAAADTSATADEAALLELARAADRPDAQAVLLPDTELSTVAHIPALEQALGKPVLTACQVTVWEALRLADRRVNAPLLGALFTREPLVQVPPAAERGRE
jgi:maleate cis-trans isomerase